MNRSVDTYLSLERAMVPRERVFSKVLTIGSADVGCQSCVTSDHEFDVWGRAGGGARVPRASVTIHNRSKFKSSSKNSLIISLTFLIQPEQNQRYLTVRRREIPGLLER